MAKKKNNKQVTKVTKEKVELWGNVFNSKDLQEQTKRYCQMVAEIYEVPPTGVVSMGNQPYLNKDARIFLLNSFIGEEKISRVKEMRVEFLQMSKSPEESSICKAIAVLENGEYYESVGEASRSSVKLEAVKNTLNMMAETRALNRVIWKIVGGHTLDRVMKNIKNADINEEDKETIVEAGRTTAEEVNQEDVSKKRSEKEFEKAKKGILRNVDHMSEEEKDELNKKIQGSDLYAKKQKDELHDLIYQG